MFLPPLRNSEHFDPYISGEVIIDESAAIASGVIIQAAVNCRVIIGSGVCIGMGSILQATEGTLEIEVGANLGAGFLMVGKGKIGANTCIGASTTILSCSVDSGQVIPAGSILGDTSRRLLSLFSDDATQPVSETEFVATQSQAKDYAPLDNPWDEEVPTGLDFAQEQLESSALEPTQEQNTKSLSNGSIEQQTNNLVEDSTPNSLFGLKPEAVPTSQLETNEPDNISSVNFGTQIYGRGNIERLLTTLFPHRQSLNKPDDLEGKR